MLNIVIDIVLIVWNFYYVYIALKNDTYKSFWQFETLNLFFAIYMAISLYGNLKN